MKNLFLLIPVLFFFSKLNAQTNIISTNPIAEQVMLGNYDPQIYLPGVVISDPHAIVQDILQHVCADSVHAYLEHLSTFYTRNSASDTISLLTGIGAARRWVFQKFTDISAANSNRLLPSYLQFNDSTICGVVQHRDIFAVLPGSDTSDNSIVLVEAHLDSRCKDLCNDTCLALGMEDNGSGTALVLELARTMSRCVYKRTIVFVLTIAEEQGLQGAYAFANYASSKGIAIRSVLNNDVVGGVFCGHTSSPPSCPGFGDIDSTHVRLFSYGGYNSLHKQYARFVKLEYKEELLPFVNVPMNIIIMSAEDRTGRGGDHIPFRQHGFTSIRMTSANENGNANVADTNYVDRQHTSDDILGLDTDGNPGLDSFFVDFNYLARNTLINATGLAMAATGPLTPDFTVVDIGNATAVINITQQTQYLQYRIGVRNLTTDWDSVYTFSNQLSDTIYFPLTATYKFSVASVDGNSIESLFSHEYQIHIVNGIEDPLYVNGISLQPNIPNPADEQTTISVLSDKTLPENSAYLSITDILGKEVQHIPLQIQTGLNEVNYVHGFHAAGVYMCTLYVDDIKLNSVKMIFSGQ